ncbi:MAG: DUF4126 domain-containing protein [Cyanobacteria bacterium P01_E01_bin.6]
METLLGIAIGVGLSAAAGFRLVVPFLIMSIASLTGHVSLAPDMAWIGTSPALAAFAIATLLEILVYFIPWLDDLMGAISIPVAVVAGTVITASFITDMSPFLRWTLAAIAGGGVAGSVEVLTTGLRFASTVATGGMANGVVSIGELLSSTVLSMLSFVSPMMAVGLVILLLFWSIRKMQRILASRRHQDQTISTYSRTSFDTLKQPMGMRLR